MIMTMNEMVTVITIAVVLVATVTVLTEGTTMVKRASEAVTTMIIMVASGQ